MTNTVLAFCIDNAYSMPFRVFWHSLEATSSLPCNVRLFILHSSTLGADSIDCIQRFLSRYGRVAEFLDASRLIPSVLPVSPSDHVSEATFYRLFVADILPPEIDQVVYLDADMLAIRSIREIFDFQVSGFVAAVDHMSPDNEIRLWGSCGGNYFQSGVLVIPLRAWRDHHLLQRFLHVMATEGKRIQWWDQDVLNLALRDCWQRLPIWWNVCEMVTRVLPSELIQTNAALIHFSGSLKPWNSFCPSVFTDRWDQSYREAFGSDFERHAFLPSRARRFKSAIRSRLSGLIHGRI